MPPKVLIVGAGISGLATAYFLSQRGIHTHIIEKAGRLGGLIQTDLIDGCQLEAGPDSFLSAKPAVVRLASTIPSLRDKVIPSNDASRRIFIVHNGRLIEFPNGMVMMVPSEWKSALASPLFSAATKLRFLRETLQGPRTRSSDVSAAQLVIDHFGEELLRDVAAPLLSGVYGGDASKLSARSVLPRFLAYERTQGSLIRSVRRERRAHKPSTGLFLSFQGGMQSLTDALTREIQPFATISNAQAASVKKSQSSWHVRTEDTQFCAQTVVLACPAHAAAELLALSAPSCSRELAAIPYSSAILVTMLYDRVRLSHPLDGFGFLVPQSERKTIAAATWINTKFPSRVPAHLAALRAFIVDPEADRLSKAGDDDLAELVHSDLKRFMNFDTTPSRHVVQRWPRSMPQYLVGHEERVSRILRLVTEASSLHLVGNYLTGIGVPDCIRVAEETANRIPAD